MSHNISNILLFRPLIFCLTPIEKYVATIKLKVKQGMTMQSQEEAKTQAHEFEGAADQVRTILKNYNIEKMFIDTQLANSVFTHKLVQLHSQPISHQDSNIESL